MNKTIIITRKEEDLGDPNDKEYQRAKKLLDTDWSMMEERE